ncbi:InlB B-repeat-containing protein [Robinsoniella sp. KNHs210]|uniref:InlB B-repeat-containing protein n=1 Tax=Robinsoniella sp. KNHs210 TaxID=1469950 RepID=UPI0009DC9AE7|nr:InlB B-repeat-containing protein [Robinsoniella sp. KNHs210]
MKVYFRRLSLALILAGCFFTSVTVLAAGDNRVHIYLRPMGGGAGTSEIYVPYGENMPQIEIPVRRGYSFQGYYEKANGQGKRYYDESGKALISCDFLETSAVYAAWQVRTYKIIYENMEQASSGTDNPVTHTYGKTTAVSDPAREGYEFFGWRINNSLTASKGLVIGAVSYDTALVLSATWNRSKQVTVVDNATETVVMDSNDLRRVYEQQVEDARNGVTADDMDSDEIILTMSARDAGELDEGASDIIQLAQGEVIKFYDFSVTKSVKKQSDSKAIVTGLNQIPNTVQVQITLSPEIGQRSGYRVYRYHNGAAELIPDGPVADPTDQTEYFEYAKDSQSGETILTIHTRRLSTYAVVGNSKILPDQTTQLTSGGTAELDVQTRVLEGGDGAVYKVDITWGGMEFEYSIGKMWDPDEHRYSSIVYDWLPHGFDGSNNRVTVYNHSNADVMVDIVTLPYELPGVDILLNRENAVQSTPATALLLSRVPAESEPAPAVSGYLRLVGTPSNLEFETSGSPNENGYIRIANVAVTITYKGGPRTPKN